MLKGGYFLLMTQTYDFSGTSGAALETTGRPFVTASGMPVPVTELTVRGVSFQAFLPSALNC